MICQRCLHWHRFLPPRVRDWYDVDDMVGDVVLHVLRQSAKYDPAKAKEVTWVFHVADNTCKSILHHHQGRQYADCETVTLTPEVVRRHGAESTMERDHAVNAIQRLIEHGSDGVCDLLDKILSGLVFASRDTQRDAWMEKDRALVEELRRAAERHGVTREDFELVLKYAVE